MPPAGFESAVSANYLPQTLAIDRWDRHLFYFVQNNNNNRHLVINYGCLARSKCRYLEMCTLICILSILHIS
jgi:hypothetical protein